MTSVRVDAYIIDTLMGDLVGHDRQPSAFLVFLLLWRKTAGDDQPSVQLSLLDIAATTGLSKRSVQGALSWLARRKLITVERESITSVPVYGVRRQWVRGER